MEFVSDLTRVDWLGAEVCANPNGAPLQVKHLLPARYSTYLALLPAVGIIENFPFDDVKPNSIDIDQINKNAAIWKRYGVYTWGRSPEYGLTTFRVLSEQFSLPYDSELLSRLEWQKRGFGCIDDVTVTRLYQFLHDLAPSALLNLYVKDYERWGPSLNGILPTDDEVLYRVRADEFVAFLRRAHFDTTLYLFPDEKNWCLVNVEDGLCPIIGFTAQVNLTAVFGNAQEHMPLTSESLVY